MLRVWKGLGVLLLLAGVVGLVPAQPPAAKGKELTIRWFGQSFFEITTPAGTKIVIDPHNLEEYRIKANALKPDLVLMTHFHTDHTNLEGLANGKTVRQHNALKKDDKGRFVNWNDVDEKFKDVRIYTIPTFHDSQKGIKNGLNGIWVIETAGLRIAHLGDLGHLLTKAQLKKLGTIDVLMVPVGGVYTINGIEAQRVVEQIKPRRWVLPMHYATPVFQDLLVLKYFLDEQDEDTVKKIFKPKEYLRIDPKSPLPKKPSVGILHYAWW